MILGNPMTPDIVVVVVFVVVVWPVEVAEEEGAAVEINGFCFHVKKKRKMRTELLAEIMNNSGQMGKSD